jgi:hypothetical protein
VNISNRRFVVDPTMGAIVAYCTFGAGSPGGGSGSPRYASFRVENGKLRYVHTLTHLLQTNFRGGGAGAARARGWRPGGRGAAPGSAPGGAPGGAPPTTPPNTPPGTAR